MKVALYFDGGCWPNPGGRAAYGWHIRDLAADGDPLIACGSGEVIGAVRSNNVAEWEGLLAGLRWLSSCLPELTSLVIRGDSRLVINTLTNRWRCKKPFLTALRAACREILDALACDWEAEWLPRQQNRLADTLASGGRRYNPVTSARERGDTDRCASLSPMKSTPLPSMERMPARSCGPKRQPSASPRNG